MTEKPTKPEDEIPPEVFELHPIVGLLARELVPAPDPEEEEFLPMAEDKYIELGAAILHYVDEENPKMELLHVVQSLAAWAYALRERSPRLSEQVIDCIAQEEVANSCAKLKVSADPEAVRETAEKFGNFSGQQADKTAPKVGEAKPEGSIDINKLNFPKRM